MAISTRLNLRSLMACLFIMLMLNSVAFAKDQKAGEPQEALATVTLIANDVKLTAEIANTPDQRYMGLSFRQSMEENNGMLFIFPNEQMLTFTMRNTLIPLSIAYISKDFIIQEIHDMPVGPNQLFPSEKIAKFALEVNQGWFERNDIEVGTKVSLRNN